MCNDLAEAMKALDGKKVGGSGPSVVDLIQTSVRIDGDVDCCCLLLVWAYDLAPAFDPRCKKGQ